MPYKCVIVDDEALARELIETHLSHLDNFEIVASCSNALEARGILQKVTIDLLFLDIEMPLLKGTDFLKGLTPKPKVIFTTAYRNYAVDGFDLNAVDFLLKPILLDRFLIAIDKFLDTYKTGKTQQTIPHIFVRSNHKNVKVLLDEVLYVESVKDYIKIHLKQERLMVKSGITVFAAKLDNRFLRIHRSFLVNTDQITAFTKQDVEIGATTLPIGDSYKIGVISQLQK